MASTPSDIEKINLEAHVELCAERYKSLEEKLDVVEKRLGDLETHVLGIKESLSNRTAGNNKQLIAVGTSIIIALLTANITLIINLINK